MVTTLKFMNGEILLNDFQRNKIFKISSNFTIKEGFLIENSLDMIFSNISIMKNIIGSKIHI